MAPSESKPPPRFATLFADSHHYRGDLRLMRTAIRHGWLNDAPQADRDALVARFEQATAERRADDADRPSLRAVLGECRVAIELEQANQNPRLLALRYGWAGNPTNQTTGRPRERWHVSDYPNRIDANELRKRAKTDGIDLWTLQAIDVCPADKPDDEGDRIALAVLPDARYGWRVWLVCPRCTRRKVHLYPLRMGIRCRTCAGIRY